MTDAMVFLRGALAAFGLTWITAALAAHQMWIRLVGGAFLLMLGVRTLLSRPAESAARASGAGPGSAVFLVAGVVLGSAAWWLVLSGLVARLRSRFDVRGLAWVNRVSGVLITGFGVLAVLSALGGAATGARVQ